MKIWAAYQRKDERDDALVVYQKLEPNAGIGNFAQAMTFIVLRRGKKGDLRWTAKDAPGSTKSWAKNTGRVAGCRTRLRSSWEIMNGDAGWVKEPGLRATELPIGFYPVTADKPNTIQAGPRKFDEGVLKNTEFREQFQGRARRYIEKIYSTIAYLAKASTHDVRTVKALVCRLQSKHV